MFASANATKRSKYHRLFILERGYKTIGHAGNRLYQGNLFFFAQESTRYFVDINTGNWLGTLYNVSDKAGLHLRNDRFSRRS